MKNTYDLFKSPGVEWRGKPFWSWNGELNKDELVRQVRVMKEMGFGGYFMHSRCGLITEYLGEEWFELTNAVADAGKEVGMENWLYDEDRWPSGSAGGKATVEMEYRIKKLVLYIVKPEAFAWEDDIMHAFAAKIAADGIGMGGYAALGKDNADEAWAKLEGCEGEAKILFFKMEYNEPHSNYNGNTYLDTMSEKAVRHFIDLTHEEYVKHCGDRVGTTINGIFTDEPDRGRAMSDFCEKNGVGTCSIFYTPDIFDEFLKRYGYDARPILPEIFFRLKGERVSKVRIDYFDLGCDLFCERFLKQINDWCNDHNNILTGHLLHEDDLSPQVVPCGSLLRGYQYMGNPGVDILGNNNYSYWVAKQCTSVARQMGQKWILSEMYGVSGWEFPLRGHKRMGDWQALFGINVRCPHLSWYTMEGECKRDYPASISYQSPYWKDYNFVETYFARFGVMMAAGKPACDLLVLHPIETIWALAHIKWAQWIYSGSKEIQALEKYFRQVFMALIEKRVDFDYGEEQIMARNWRIEDGKLYIGQAAYRTVLITGALTIRESTLNILREFLKAGGRVVFTGELPQYVGGMPSDACAKLVEEFENAVIEEFDSLGDAMLAVDTCPVVADASEKIFSQVRVDGENYISAWLNTDSDNASGEFTITANIPEGYRAEIWSMETGERMVYPSEYKDGKLTLKCSMEPAGSMILVFTKSQEVIAEYKECDLKVTGELAEGEFAFELDEPNVMVLDYARSKFADDAEFGPLKEALKIDQDLRDRIGIEHRGGEMLQPWFSKMMYKDPYGKLTLEYPFKVDVLPEGKVYLAGERPELQEYYCNGVRLNAPDLSDWWVDNAFVKMEIPEGALKTGENIISIVVDFKRTTNIEAIYLVGNFGVKAEAGASVMTKMPETVGLDDMACRNLPFYSGCATVEITADQYDSLVDKTADRIWMQIPDCSGTLANVECLGKKTVIAWEPYMADVTDAVKAGAPIRVTLVNSRRNSFGPLHIVPTRLGGYGPGEFVTKGEKWHDDYSLIEAQIGKIVFKS